MSVLQVVEVGELAGEHAGSPVTLLSVTDPRGETEYDHRAARNRNSELVGHLDGERAPIRSGRAAGGRENRKRVVGRAVAHNEHVGQPQGNAGGFQGDGSGVFSGGRHGARQRDVESRGGARRQGNARFIHGQGGAGKWGVRRNRGRQSDGSRAVIRDGNRLAYRQHSGFDVPQRNGGAARRLW